MSIGKIARGVSAVGRGFLRFVLGFGGGAILGAIFWCVLLSYTATHTHTWTSGGWFTPVETHTTVYYTTEIFGGLGAILTLAIIIGIISAIGSAVSIRFLYLMATGFFCSLGGGVAWGILCPLLHYPDILGKVIFLLILLVATPFIWIWWMVHDGVIVEEPGIVPAGSRSSDVGGVVATIGREFGRTVHEITRFGRKIIP